MNAITRSLIVAVMLALPGLALAQTSELYLHDGETTVTYVVQNGQLVRQFNRSGSVDGPGLVVQDTIKMIGRHSGGVGREYALDGTPLAGRYPNPEFTDVFDGATNGEHNWSVAHNHFPDFPVVVGDADWGNLQRSFVPQRRSSGITYDANTGTLWLANNVGGTDRIQQYDLEGNLLSEFNASVQGGYGLAWDPADDTLWLPGSWGTSDLFQFDKQGNLLQRLPVKGLSQRILGAEFQFGGGGCGEKAKLKVKCPKNGTKVRGKLKKANPNVLVTFRLDGGQAQAAQTNNKGKAKSKWKGQEPGGHTVTVCDLEESC